jgi:hypothetical protein
MPNTWTTEDRTIFKDVITAFEDNLNTSLNVAMHGTEGELMERANDIINRPVPMIVTSENRTVGSATTARDVTELKVPSALDQKKVVPLKLSALEQRDSRRLKEMTTAAGRRLASDIEQSTQSEIFDFGSLCVPVSGAAGDYDDVALAESMMLEQGMANDPRCFGFNARDYNGLAGNLSAATRSFGNAKSDSAYERSFVGSVAGFDTFKLGATQRLAAAGGTSTIDTTGALVQYAPSANTDNRTQQITVSATASVVAGDRFTIAGIEAVNHESKVSTGQLKTFVVVSVDSGTLMTISPPIIGANSTPTDAEEDYKNVEVASTSATAAITYLNANAANANYFWTKDSIEILAGRYALPGDQGTQVMRGTTDQGIELAMTKEFSGTTYTSLYHFDILYGVTNLAPEKNGILIFGQ